MSKKLGAKSRSVVLLREWLESGKLTGKEVPSTVQAMSPIFACYKPDKFRRALNKLRKEVGTTFGIEHCNDAEAPNDIALSRRCSNSVVEPVVKKAKLDPESDLSDFELEDSGQAVQKLQDDARFFKPFTMLSVWKEPRTTAQRLTVAILLPTGVGYKDYTLQVLNGGTILQMKCRWPQEFCQVEVLHRKWLRCNSDDSIRLYHPKITEMFLKEMRRRSSDCVDSIADILLPFPVESHIYGQYNLGWREATTKVVYADLRAFVEAYSVVNDNPTFEIS